MGPGLQGHVGRVPSRGGTFDAVYNSRNLHKETVDTGRFSPLRQGAAQSGERGGELPPFSSRSAEQAIGQCALSTYQSEDLRVFMINAFLGTVVRRRLRRLQNGYLAA